MKKWMPLLLTLLVCAVFACSAQETPCAPVIRLPGNPTTGYTWTCVVSTPDVLAVSEKYTADEEGMMGAGGEYAFVLNGLAAGKAEVTFTYARSWETDQSAQQIVCLAEVDEALHVTILEMEFLR